MRGVEEIVGGGDAGVHVGRVVVGRDPFGDDGGEDAAGAVRVGAVRGGGDYEETEFAKGGEEGFVGLGEPGGG